MKMEHLFRLGDTGCLLFNRLDRDKVDTYLENRKQNGYNADSTLCSD